MPNKTYIKERLAERIPALIRTLFPDKKQDKLGHEYRLGSKGSLSISEKGFCSFEDNAKGDLIALVQYAHNCDFREALRWCEAFLGISSNDEYIAPKPHKKPKVSPTPLRRKNDEAERIYRAREIWHYSKSATDTLAQEYLQKRGIKITPPVSIKFNPYVYHFELKAKLPALVAGVQNLKGEITGIQAIFIDPDTKGKINRTFVDEQGKEQKAKAKLCFGSIKGGAVRISNRQYEIVVCEGLEDGLTILQSCSDKCVWIGCGGNIVNVEFPKDVRSVIIAPDNDNASEKFTKKLATRLTKEGREVSKINPPQPFKDFNELLTQNMEVNND